MDIVLNAQTMRFTRQLGPMLGGLRSVLLWAVVAASAPPKAAGML